MLFSYHRQIKPVYRFILLLPLCLQLVACGSESEEGIRRPDIGDAKPEVSIHRLEQAVFEAKSKDEITAFLQENELFAQKFLRLSDYPHDSLVVNQLWQLGQDPHLDTVYRESQQIFPDLSQWEEEFATAFGYIQHYYPDFQPPKIYTMVTGFGTDLFVSDEMDMVVIGLDYFMGPEATYRPAELPQYIQRRYGPEYVVPGVMLLLSARYNQADLSDRSMLAEMLYYGKSYYFVDFVLPQVADSVIIGYTDEEMQGLYYNQGTIWNHFLTNELLFETNHVQKKKYLEERPKTLEIGDKAPGRIGTWLGWEIVRAYMRKNEEVGLRQLMETEDARLIFNQAKYSPQNQR